MPIYEYRCGECQQLFEEWCKHVEDGDMPHSCPICKGRAHRIMSNTSFALKGGGWYVTEYGSRCPENANCSSKTSSETGAASTPEPAPACASSASSESAPKAAAGTSA